MGPRHPQAIANRPTSPMLSKGEQYKRMTIELNKCFDDIELFVRYLETVTSYTKTLEHDEKRRKGKKSGFYSFFFGGKVSVKMKSHSVWFVFDLNKRSCQIKIHRNHYSLSRRRFIEKRKRKISFRIESY